MMSIPFEALDVQVGKDISLDIDRIFKKVITDRRGGFCYELNFLFHSLLSSLGFDSTMVSSKIFEGGKYGPEFDHMSILVRLDLLYLADVGFGDLFLEPLVLEDGGIQEDQFKNYKFQNLSSTQILLHESLKNRTEFKEVYIIDTTPRRIEEFLQECKYKQYSPDSHFVQNTICTIATEYGRKTIKNDLFKVRNLGVSTKYKIIDDADRQRILKREFGIVLDSWPRSEQEKSD